MKPWRRSGRDIFALVIMDRAKQFIRENQTDRFFTLPITPPHRMFNIRIRIRPGKSIVKRIGLNLPDVMQLWLPWSIVRLARLLICYRN